VALQKSNHIRDRFVVESPSFANLAGHRFCLPGVKGRVEGKIVWQVQLRKLDAFFDALDNLIDDGGLGECGVAVELGASPQTPEEALVGIE
jgi:hypothetical protein